jgi:hypothetical protein
VGGVPAAAFDDNRKRGDQRRCEPRSFRRKTGDIQEKDADLNEARPGGSTRAQLS